MVDLLVVVGPISRQVVPYSEEARDLAWGIEILATDLEDGDLKQENIRTTNLQNATGAERPAILGSIPIP